LQEFKTQAMIGNIKTDGIIGLYFLQTNQCLVVVCNTKMHVHGVEHKLEVQGNIGCFHVSLCEIMSIPPRSEMVCSGQVLDLPNLPDTIVD
jgi:hypothetical protein